MCSSSDEAKRDGIVKGWHIHIVVLAFFFLSHCSMASLQSSSLCLGQYLCVSCGDAVGSVIQSRPSRLQVAILIPRRFLSRSPLLGSFARIILSLESRAINLNRTKQHGLHCTLCFLPELVHFTSTQSHLFLLLIVDQRHARTHETLECYFFFFPFIALLLLSRYIESNDLKIK